jgi:hypothetical protein
MEHSSNIERISILVEPPTCHVLSNSNFPPIPIGFFDAADKSLSLSGRLLSFLNDKGVPAMIQIARLTDIERYEFFAGRALSERWEVYSGSLKSGWRYNVLIEFSVRPSVEFRDPNLRKQIYEEHENLLYQMVSRFMMENVNASKEAARDHAFEESSRSVGIKYGISKKDLLDIIVEGSEKWSQYYIKFKTDQN